MSEEALKLTHAGEMMQPRAADRTFRWYYMQQEQYTQVAGFAAHVVHRALLTVCQAHLVDALQDVGEHGVLVVVLCPLSTAHELSRMAYRALYKLVLLMKDECRGGPIRHSHTQTGPFPKSIMTKTDTWTSVHVTAVLAKAPKPLMQITHMQTSCGSSP